MVRREGPKKKRKLVPYSLDHIDVRKAPLDNLAVLFESMHYGRLRPDTKTREEGIIRNGLIVAIVRVVKKDKP